LHSDTIGIMNSNYYNFKQARIYKSCKTTEIIQCRRVTEDSIKVNSSFVYLILFVVKIRIFIENMNLAFVNVIMLCTLMDFFVG